MPSPVTLWNLNNGERIADLEGHEVSVIQVAFDGSGKRLYSLDSNGQTIRGWDVASREPVKSIELPPTKVFRFDIMPDQTAITAVASNEVFQFSLPSRAQSRHWTHKTYTQVIPSINEIPIRNAMSPDGEILALAGSGGVVELYSMKDGLHIEAIKLRGGFGLTKSLRFTPDGRHLLVTNFNGTVYVLRLKEWAIE